MSKSISPSEKSRTKNLLEELQSSFIRRFSRTPLSQEPIVYEFTNDRALLHQYYRLREIMYRKVFKTELKFVGEEDLHDKISHTLIARRGKLCIGGCRLTIREGDENFLLPMETPNFKLRDAFPNLPLTKLRHGEISRFAVLDEDDDKFDVMYTLYQLIAEKSKDAEVGAVFYKAPLPMSRNWRKIGHSCGLEKIRICTEIKVPELSLLPEVTWYVTEVILPTAEAILNKENILLTQPIDSLVH